MTDFTLPELGENITAGDVLRLLVKPGDMLAKDQPVLELETDEATIEVPSSVAGQVKDIKVKAGDKVKVGQAILSVEENAGEAQAAKSQPPDGAATEKAAAAPAEQQRPAAGPPKAASRPQPAAEQAGAGVADSAAQAPDDDARVDTRGAQSAGASKVVDINRGARQASEPGAAPELPVAPAAPSARRMARELGVDVNQVDGSGPAGRISVEDVKSHAKRLVTGGGGGAAGGPTAP